MIEIDEFYDVKGELYQVKITNQESILEECDGMCDTANRLIYIRQELPDRRKYEVLAHELGHALFSELGLHQTDIDSNLEEIIVEGFASFFLATFRLAKRKVYNRIAL